MTTDTTNHCPLCEHHAREAEKWRERFEHVQDQLNRKIKQCAEAEEALEAMKKASHRGGWRPIEEASTDGTLVLITGFRKGKPWLERFVRVALCQGGRWCDATGRSLYPPTHFMSLPDPPADVRPEVMAVADEFLTKYADVWVALAKGGCNA